MTTIDLTAPRRVAAPSTNVLDPLPRRASLTLTELELLAEKAGGAPLPFQRVETPASNPLEGRLGQSRHASDERAFAASVAALHEPTDSLTRRGLIVDGVPDTGLVGALGLLATPQVALDLDLVIDGVQAHAWHRQSGDAVVTLSTIDGIVFELAWFDAGHWSGDLTRFASLPETVDLGDSAVPATVDLPFELLDAVGEALRDGRTDLVPVLVGQHAEAVHDHAGQPVSEAAAATIVASVHTEGRGRLRGMVAHVGESTTQVGVISWVLLADGWHALCAHRSRDQHRVEVRRVDPADLPTMLAPVLSEVIR